MSQERNEDMTELDRMLAQMAQETPEMPADFHARWTEAVRAEAGQKKTEKQQDSRRQWRYILSAAAVFVFLIGGTLLTRSMDQKDRTNKAAVTENTVIPSEASEPDADLEEDLFMAVNEAAEEPETDMAEPVASGARPNAAVAAMGAKAAESAVKEDSGMNAAMDTAAEETAEEAPAETEKTAKKTAEEPAGAQPEEKTEPAQESEFVSFLKDLGIFTLKALAAALVIAAAGFGVKAFRKARRK